MRFLFITALILGLSISVNSATINIQGQEEFSALPEFLKQIVERGEKHIVIKIAPGQYCYSQSMISLSAQDDDLSLSIVGNGVTLLPLFSEKRNNLVPSFAQFRGKDAVNLWSEVVQSPELISVVDQTNKLCRIRISRGITAQIGDYIQVSQWYRTQRYNVVSSDKEYIYFIADDLSYICNKQEWNINYDYIYAKKNPRYRVFRVKSDDEILQSSVTTFMDVSQAKLKRITIKGISFIGSAGSRYSKGVINFSNASAKEINIENCRFSSCRSSCIKLENTSNLKVDDCDFYDNYTTCVSIGTNCDNASITNNLFENNGKEWNNSHVVLMKGTDFYISDNVFRDFCYGAIGAGIWYKHKKTTEVSGVIANNEIYYTEDYYKDYPKYTLMDSGAIYLWTQMDDVTIQGNYIHDIYGMEDNRGIFCDDGAKNVKIVNNLIRRIGNSYCIDLREASYVTEFVPDCNTGNHCFNNLLDGTMRFFIKDKSCKENFNLEFGQINYKKMPAFKQWRHKLK